MGGISVLVVLGLFMSFYALYLFLIFISIFYLVENYIFESAVLARDCGIHGEQTDRVMEELSLLKVVSKQELTVNNQKRTLFRSHPGHILIALFSIARKIGYSGAYSLQSHWKSTPFFGSEE